MSLAEIKNAVTDLTPKELAELAAFIQAQDREAWDREIEEDFSPGAKHRAQLAEIDGAIDAVEATRLTPLQALDGLQKHLQLDPQKAAKWMDGVREARR